MVRLVLPCARCARPMAGVMYVTVSHFSLASALHLVLHFGSQTLSLQFLCLEETCSSFLKVIN